MDLTAQTKCNYYTRVLCSDEEHQDSVVTTQPLRLLSYFYAVLSSCTGFITLYSVKCP